MLIVAEMIEENQPMYSCRPNCSLIQYNSMTDIIALALQDNYDVQIILMLTLSSSQLFDFSLYNVFNHVGSAGKDFPG